MKSPKFILNAILQSYDIRKDEQKPNKFVREFKALNPNEKYTIFTDDFSNVEFRDDY